MSELSKLSFLLKPAETSCALTLFLQDVAAGRDLVERYCIVMTRIISERVDLGSASDGFVWDSLEYTVSWMWGRNIVWKSWYFNSEVKTW